MSCRKVKIEVIRDFCEKHKCYEHYYEICSMMDKNDCVSEDILPIFLGLMFPLFCAEARYDYACESDLEEFDHFLEEKEKKQNRKVDKK